MATSQAKVSRELRDTIREMVQKGKSNEVIYQYVERNYGEKQIAVPRRGFLYRLSYGFPYLVMGIISVIGLGFAWQWAGRFGDNTSEVKDVNQEDNEKINQVLSQHDGPFD